MFAKIKTWLKDYWSGLVGGTSPFNVGIIIWAWYTGAFSFFLGLMCLFGDRSYFDALAYDYVKVLMPLQLWGVVWMIPVVFHLFAVALRRYPFFAARHIRRQFTSFAIVQGVWMISFLILVFQGELEALTPVLVWLGITIATITILFRADIYSARVAKLNKVNYSHLPDDASWRKCLQW